MPGATTDADRLRLALDNILAPLAEAQDLLRAAITCMAQRARTEYDADNLRRVVLARRSIEVAQERVSALHVNGTHKN